MTTSPFRQFFSLDPNMIFLDNLLLSSHSIPLQEHIDKLKTEFNRGAGNYWEWHVAEQEERSFHALADFLDCSDEEIAITSSSTMSVGIALAGLKLKTGSEIVISEQEHYSVHKATEYNCKMKDWKKKVISWYEDPTLVNDQEVLKHLETAIGPDTRVVFATWVHSATGVRLPIAKMGAYIENINLTRDEKILFIVDGTHGFGIENFKIKDLNCHVFFSSCHKWLFGPRGTGMCWFDLKNSHLFVPIIPTYDGVYFENWRLRSGPEQKKFGRLMSPGGFWNFEHRWALANACELQQKWGREEIEKRSKNLARYLKNSLCKLPKVKLITPLADEFSSALVCFEVQNIHPDNVVNLLYKERIVCTSTPYYKSFVRFSPAIANDEKECDLAVEAMARLLAQTLQ